MNNFHRFQNFRQFSNLFSQIWLKKRHTSLFSGIWREIRTKFHKKIAETNCKIRRRNWKKHQKFNIQSRKNVDDFWLKFWDWRTVQRSALCRSRRELSNAYLLAKIGFDTAENEPGKVSPIEWRAPGAQLRNAARRTRRPGRGGRDLRPPRPVLLGWDGEDRRTRGVVAKFWQIFGKSSLVFGCIGADLCK